MCPLVFGDGTDVSGEAIGEHIALANNCLKTAEVTSKRVLEREKISKVLAKVISSWLEPKHNGIG